MLAIRERGESAGSRNGGLIADFGVGGTTSYARNAEASRSNNINSFQDDRGGEGEEAAAISLCFIRQNRRGHRVANMPAKYDQKSLSKRERERDLCRFIESDETIACASITFEFLLLSKSGSEQKHAAVRDL